MGKRAFADRIAEVLNVNTCFQLLGILPYSSEGLIPPSVPQGWNGKILVSPPGGPVCPVGEWHLFVPASLKK